MRSAALVIAWNMSVCSKIHCSALPERKAGVFSCRTLLSVEQRDIPVHCFAETLLIMAPIISMSVLCDLGKN